MAWTRSGFGGGSSSQTTLSAGLASETKSSTSTFAPASNVNGPSTKSKRVKASSSALSGAAMARVATTAPSTRSTNSPSGASCSATNPINTRTWRGSRTSRSAATTEKDQFSGSAEPTRWYTKDSPASRNRSAKSGIRPSLMHSITAGPPTGQGDSGSVLVA